jgi:hypothetical protein
MWVIKKIVGGCPEVEPLWIHCWWKLRNLSPPSRLRSQFASKRFFRTRKKYTQERWLAKSSLTMSRKLSYSRIFIQNVFALIFIFSASLSSSSSSSKYFKWTYRRRIFCVKKEKRRRNRRKLKGQCTREVQMLITPDRSSFTFIFSLTHSFCLSFIFLHHRMCMCMCLFQCHFAHAPFFNCKVFVILYDTRLTAMKRKKII